MAPTPSPWIAVTALALWGALPSRAAEAQLAPLTAPKGLLRVEGFTGFGTWDRRFFNGENQPLAQDWIRPALGSDFFPALLPAEEALQRVSGIPDARFDLGRSSARQTVTFARSGFGLAYGLTDRITLFGRVPIVRVRVRSSLGLDSENANAGFNPADPTFGSAEGAALIASFFAAFDAALADLADRIASGAYDADPGTRTLAEQTLLLGESLRADLFALTADPTTASPFLPTSGSGIGAAILARIGALQATLSGPLGVESFSQTPALPTEPLGEEGLHSFLTNPDGPVAGLLETPVLNTLGEIELGVAVTLLDRVDEAVRGRGLRVAGQVLARLPTGQEDRPEAFFDVGAGDRQNDVEMSLVADAVFPWGGIRGEAGYNLQLARGIIRRIAPPSEPAPYASREAGVSRDPGDVVSFAVTPYLRLAPTFALFGGLRYSDRGADAVGLVAGQEPIPGAAASLLAEESAVSWIEWNAGISFRSPLRERGDRRLMPLDAAVTVSGISSGSGGRVPRPLTVRALLRLYRPFP